MEQSLNIKNKVGAPKKANPKKQITLRLSQEAILIIKAQSNQSTFIENLIIKS